MKVWLLQRRRALIITVCVVGMLLVAVYALAYVKTWRQFQDGRIYYHHRFYDLSASAVTQEDLQEVQPTSTTIFGEEVYDRPQSTMTSAGILLRNKTGAYHSYVLVGGP